MALRSFAVAAALCITAVTSAAAPDYGSYDQTTSLPAPPVSSTLTRSSMPSASRPSSFSESAGLGSSRPSMSRSASPSVSGSVFSGTSGRIGQTVPIPGSINTAASCTSTITNTEITTSTPTLSTTTVVVVSTDYINGDDGIPVNPSTVPFIQYSQTYISQTHTISYTTTVGPATTVTAAAPAGFVKVQDTLPGAIYVNETGGDNPLDKRNAGLAKIRAIKAKAAHRKRACESVTTITTSTITAIASTTTISVTKRTVYITWPSENTGIPADSYSSVSPTRTTTIGYTAYPKTFFYTTTVTTQDTATSTKTVYEACETSNFANYIVKDDGSTTNINIQNGSAPVLVEWFQTAYECGAFAIENRAASWTWGVPNIQGCGIFVPGFNDGSCPAQEDAQFEAFTGDNSTTWPVVVGNGYCGEISSSRPRPPP